MLKYALLGILNYQSMTGYELKQFMETSTNHFWYAKQSQIYTTLKSLEGEKQLASHVEAQADRPDRRIYTITDAGREALQQWLGQPVTEVELVKDTFLLKLFFSASLNKETILTQLRLQRSLSQQQANIFQNETIKLIAQTATHNPELALDTMLWEATRRLGELTLQTHISWLDETIALVEENF